ncbi:transmembrane protein 145-like [Physella acuta]|uniref:transmembrane protein 145-like n=1 Tax=Physella acuta TaxID=109671 RepID=UPI0027DBC29E|nr:transmembrane protein 145-like [Physella acuta]
MFAIDRIVIVFVILVLTCVQDIQTKWVEGTIKTDSDWMFLTRFCFLSNIGNMNYKLEYPTKYGIQNLLFYYDVPGQWDAVYKRDLTCDEQVAALRGSNIFPLAPAGSMCVKELRKGQEWYVCTGDMDFSSARERWWFVVLSRCGPPANNTARGMYLDYKLHMTNGDDLLHKEFSADEFYILVIDIIFFIIYIILVALSIACAVVLVKRKLLHTTYKMYMVTLIIWFLHLLCMVIAWGSYGSTGWELRPLEVFGRILQACGHIVFMLMLILMAKGYTIVRGRLSKKNAVKITVFINLYVIALVVLFIWEGVLFDPGLVLYYYESPPGYGMITVILIGWLWFTKAAVFTLKHYNSKSHFYIVFYTIFTIWFWAAPFTTMLAMFAMEKWTREKSVNGIQQLIACIGHSVFLFLTMPSRANGNFPYHIKTTQIDTVSEAEDETSRSDSPYTISSSEAITGTGPNLAFFVTFKGGKSEVVEGDRPMYKALDRYPFTGDNSPPSYPQAMALPPIGHQVTNQNYTNALYENNQQNSEQNQVSANKLPPLRRAILGDLEGEAQTTLPPVRGTGLPSIVPSAPTQPIQATLPPLKGVGLPPITPSLTLQQH